MSGFSLKCLDQDADRISVQSNLGPTWWAERRKYKWLPAKAHDVGLMMNEVVIIKTHGAINRITLTAREADIIVQSTRRGTRYIRAGAGYAYDLMHDETLIIRTLNATDPTTPHRIPTPQDVADGMTP